MYFCGCAGLTFPGAIAIMIYYIEESTAERRARRNRNIKTLFQHLTIDEHMPFMDAYEAVGYHFYESADHIRKILRLINKSGQDAH